MKNGKKCVSLLWWNVTFVPGNRKFFLSILEANHFDVFFFEDSYEVLWFCLIKAGCNRWRSCKIIVILLSTAFSWFVLFFWWFWKKYLFRMCNGARLAKGRTISTFSGYCNWCPLHVLNKSDSHHCGLFVLPTILVPQIWSTYLGLPVLVWSQLWVFFTEGMCTPTGESKHIGIIHTFSSWWGHVNAYNNRNKCQNS